MKRRVGVNPSAGNLLIEHLRSVRVIPVVEIEDARLAVRLAERC
jgi:hypothetical protein